MAMFAFAVFGAGCVSGPLIRQAATMNARGAVLLAHGDLDGAEAAFSVAIEYNDRFSEPHNNLGLVALQRGRVIEARRHFSAAVARNRDFAEAWSNLGVAYTRGVSDSRDAVVGGTRSNPGRASQEDLREAEHAFRESLSINPGLSEPRLNLVRLLLARGDHEQALAQSRRLVQVAPEVALAHALRAASALDAGRVDEAADAARAATERDPSDADVTLVAARVALVRGELVDAEHSLQSVASDARLGREAHALLAAIYVSAGRHDDARAQIAAMGPGALDHPVVRRLTSLGVVFRP